VAAVEYESSSSSGGAASRSIFFIGDGIGWSAVIGTPSAKTLPVRKTSERPNFSGGGILPAGWALSSISRSWALHCCATATGMVGSTAMEKVEMARR